MLRPGARGTNGRFPSARGAGKPARKSDRLDDAILLYRKALALRPAWAEGWWYLDTLLYDEDDYTGAAGALRKAIELSPQTGNAAAMLGLCEAKLGHDRDALRHLEKGRALGVGGDQSLHRVTLYTKGTLLLAAGEFSKAQKTLDLLAREGADQELMDALGESVLGIRPEDMTSADAAKREVVRRAGQAEHAAAGGDVHAALAAYSRLLASAPKFHNVQFASGQNRGRSRRCRRHSVYSSRGFLFSPSSLITTRRSVSSMLARRAASHRSADSCVFRDSLRAVQGSDTFFPLPLPRLQQPLGQGGYALRASVFLRG